MMGGQNSFFFKEKANPGCEAEQGMPFSQWRWGLSSFTVRNSCHALAPGPGTSTKNAPRASSVQEQSRCSGLSPALAEAGPGQGCAHKLRPCQAPGDSP